MKKSWILVGVFSVIMLVVACSSKSKDVETTGGEDASTGVVEVISESVDGIARVKVNGNVYVESKDGVITNTVPVGWSLLGSVIDDKELPLDGDLYGNGCGLNGMIYYNEQDPVTIYVGSENVESEEEESKKSVEEETKEKVVRYRKFLVENLNWQYIAWEGNLFVRVSDLLESSRADSLTEDQKNTAVVELPLQAECIGTVIGRSDVTVYPTENLEMNVPDYNGMYVCKDRENPNYIYVETFFHSVKRYIIFLKTEKPSVP